MDFLYFLSGSLILVLQKKLDVPSHNYQEDLDL